VLRHNAQNNEGKRSMTMREKFEKLSINVKVAGTAVLMGALLVINGCGGGDSAPAVSTAQTQITASQATLDAAGTVTTTTSVTANNVAGTVAITIPTATTITATDAAGTVTKFAALPVINVTTPVSGVSGMPQPVTAGLTISSAAGSVDVSIGGANTLHFSPAITITIPITDQSKLTSPYAIYTNKNDGNGYKFIGNGTLSSDGKTVSIQVTDLCWLTVGPTFQTVTGTTGGTGNGSNF
jgi:hypothetical protein